MANPLHSAETLSSLAQGPEGTARDWATTRLALSAPEQFSVFPTGDDMWDVLLAAGPPKLVPSMISALKNRDHCPEGLAASIAGMAAFGVLPQDPAALIGAISESSGVGDADLWLAFSLAQMGATSGAVLGRASKINSIDADWLMPLAVLHAGAQGGALDIAATEVAKGLGPKLMVDPSLLQAILGGLGVPIATGSETAYQELSEPEGAAHFGAYLANASLPVLPQIKGSRRRRTQAWIQALLEGVEHPAAGLLRALYKDDANLDWGMWPLTTAAWLRAYEPSEPIEDVLNRNAGGDGQRLSAARRMALDVEPKAIQENLHTHGNTSAAVVAMPHIVGGNAPELADAVIQHLVDGARNARAVALATASAWYQADNVPDLIQTRATRDFGLLLAEWVPTEGVLSALLQLEVPSDPDARLLYARCLAQMGDRAVIPTLGQLLEQDNDGALEDAQILAEGIFGQAIG